MNTLGQNLTLTTFGESHGPAIGGVLDGFPSGITVDLEYVRECMQRRRPGQSTVTTGRQDVILWLPMLAVLSQKVLS